VLAHSLVTPKSADPERYMLFLHGILGTRANWRAIARRFVEARPTWGAILVDLREHGDSLGRSGPHTLRAAADDLRELAASLDRTIGGAVGHSFGGKVVLEWLRGRGGEATEAWTIDASPSSSDTDPETSSTAEVLRVLRELPERWSSRDAFVKSVTDAGQPEAIAQWLAMNLKRLDDGSRAFGPSLDSIDELLMDYARTDLWGVVEALPEQCTLDVVVGGRSPAFGEGDRRRMARLAARDSRLSYHLVEEAGHWVHVDSPDTLVSLLTRAFASAPGNGN
jgi:pimeloyl-ACP methyl ester carboxylesterase